MSETEPEPPVDNPNPQPDPVPDEPEQPPVEQPPQDPPTGDEPEFCTSVYPNDSAITCQLPYQHNPRRLHCRQTGGPDSPYYEWE